MLTQTLTHLRNYFAYNQKQDVSLKLENSIVALPESYDLKIGQYIFIRSDLNRCVCKVVAIDNDTHEITIESDTALTDDYITYMALLRVPRHIVELSENIALWQEKQGNNAITSESFGGWSGSYAQGKHGTIKWQENFASELKPWQRLFADISEVS